MSETCECLEHGTHRATFVCKHILTAPRGGTEGFVSYESRHDGDLRNAWCEACEAILQAHGADLMEGSVEVPGGFHRFCSQCYRSREAEARRAGRRFIHRA
jgi:hypothetical protein